MSGQWPQCFSSGLRADHRSVFATDYNPSLMWLFFTTFLCFKWGLLFLREGNSKLYLYYNLPFTSTHLNAAYSGKEWGELGGVFSLVSENNKEAKIKDWALDQMGTLLLFDILQWDTEWVLSVTKPHCSRGFINREGTYQTLLVLYW